MAEEAPRPLYERHIQTAVLLVLSGLCSWVLVSLTTLSKEVAVLNSQMLALQTQMEHGTSDRYTATQAGRDNATQDAKADVVHADVYRRIEILERYHRASGTYDQAPALDLRR